MDQGKRRGLFELRHLILEQNLEIFSPDMRRHINESIAHLGKSLFYNTELNREQRNFLEASLVNGAVSLEGLPGTGKTLTLGYLITLLAIYRRKVIGTAHSSGAVAVLTSAVTKLVKNQAVIHKSQPEKARVFDDILDGIVRVYSPNVRQTPSRLLTGPTFLCCWSMSQTTAFHVAFMGTSKNTRATKTSRIEHGPRNHHAFSRAF